MDTLMCWKLVSITLMINNLVMCFITRDENIKPLAYGVNFVISLFVLAGVL